MGQHTPEPWAYDPDTRNYEQPFNIQPQHGKVRILMDLEDFERACLCVNALAGLSTTEVEGLRYALAAAAAARKGGSPVVKSVCREMDAQLADGHDIGDQDWNDSGDAATGAGDK